jgi:hypothetical protein
MIGKNTAAALEHLKAVPFVRGVRLVETGTNPDRLNDGFMEIKTPGGQYRLSVQSKRSYLDRSLVNALIARTEANQTAAKQDNTRGKLLLARYVPVALGEQLVEAGICFADDPGNIHLQLGSEYSWTVLGKREPAPLPEADRTTPATIQLLFQFATEPPSAKWPVRDLAGSAGISKTRVAQIRGQFVRERVLKARAHESEFRVTPEIADRLVAGYSQILRPKILLGRYRYQEQSADQFVARLSHEAATQKIPYALTGGPAADAMQHFYRSSDIPVFLHVEHHRALRLLPDRTGPVVLLKPFGDLVYWREFEGRMVAPPWLVYAELLNGSDPRAREAAEELRREFLK